MYKYMYMYIYTRKNHSLHVDGPEADVALIEQDTDTVHVTKLDSHV